MSLLMDALKRAEKARQAEAEKAKAEGGSSEDTGGLALERSERHRSVGRPRPAEKVCIRPAVIEFPYCDELRSDRVAGKDVVEITGNLGHGAIEDLRVVADGRYEISGEFGTVSIDAERPILRLKGP